MPYYQYHVPRKGTMAEKIVEMLRRYPNASYPSIAWKLKSTRARVANVACVYRLKRGWLEADPESIAEMIRLRKLGLPLRATARKLGYSTPTVKKYGG